jgi:S-adenosylmethionine synthetase
LATFFDRAHTSETARAIRMHTKRATYLYIHEHISMVRARHDADIAPTVACAPVGCDVAKLYDYRAKMLEIRTRALEAALTVTDAPVRVAVNSADRDPPNGVYVTVTELSGESGDDGQLGRGICVNGRSRLTGR